MKRFFTLISVATLALCGFAQSVEGLYRIQNVSTSRYVHVVDNKCTNKGFDNGGNPDLNAIEMKGNMVLTDPSCIIYVQDAGAHNGNNAFRRCDLRANGVSVAEILGSNIIVSPSSGVSGAYECWATKDVYTKYLADIKGSKDVEIARAADKSGATAQQRAWKLMPINDTYYFGVKTTVELNGKYYATLVADFDFVPASSDIKVYKISAVNETTGKYTMEELTGNVPARTPVVIECSSSDPAQNRLSIKIPTANTVSGNKLVANFYDHEKGTEGGNEHFVATPVTSTMRFLAAEDGKLVFKQADTSTRTYVAANSAYLTVAASCPGVLKNSADVTRGDVNSDGKFNVTDIVAVRTIMANPTNVPSNLSKDAADANGDGKVNVTDIVKIRTLMAK